MTLRTLSLAATAAACLLLTPAAHADNQAIAIDEMAAYLEFVDYGGGVIFAEQIPKETVSAAPARTRGIAPAARRAASTARHAHRGCWDWRSDSLGCAASAAMC